VRTILTFLLLAAAVFGLYWYAVRVPEPVMTDTDKAVEVVRAFGEELQHVPLGGSVDDVRAAIDTRYARHATALLIAEWKDDPKRAPGRLTSSPWPVRIDVDAVAENADGSRLVQGRVIEITSVELVEGGSAHEYAIEALVTETDAGWRIASFRRL
jgi:hypothetical protein